VTCTSLLGVWALQSSAGLHYTSPPSSSDKSVRLIKVMLTDNSPPTSTPTYSGICESLW
jgi:hypothetical protein